MLDFAQVAVGGGYRAYLVIDNPNSASVQCGLNFRNTAGQSLTMQINGVTASSAAFSIPALGSIKFRLEDPGVQIKTGWAQVFANRPVGGVLVYQLLDGSNVVAQASVLFSPRARRFSLLVSQLGSTTDTGLAIANPEDAAALITLRRLTADGLIIAETAFTLGPGEQLARFVSQFFPAGFALLDGRVEISSNRNVVALGLIFQGNQFTTLPVIPLP